MAAGGRTDNSGSRMDTERSVRKLLLSRKRMRVTWMRWYHYEDFRT
jgi:hypothetical protein